MQKLIGRVAALNRFIFRATDKCLILLKVLKKTFEWKDECEKAFLDLKKFFGCPSLLSRPVLGEKLYLYLVISESAVFSTLIQLKGEI